jgi:hypothetical protein
MPRNAYVALGGETKPGLAPADIVVWDRSKTIAIRRAVGLQPNLVVFISAGLTGHFSPLGKFNLSQMTMLLSVHKSPLGHDTMSKGCFGGEAGDNPRGML